MCRSADQYFVMKKSPLLLAALSFAVVVGLPDALLAKTGSKNKILAKYDANKNGKLDSEEIEAIRKDFATSPEGELKVFDKDSDGKLSDTEIAAISGES